ncbi:MAG: fimbrial protein [Cyanobacteria bacterium RI_101]|nr:fimbrial protein [Cyanobacteria bacterium RI_101]
MATLIGLAPKGQLLDLLAPLQAQIQDAPLTPLTLPPATAERIETLTQQVEAENPTLNPLLYAPQKLDGVWRLRYSTAREIKALAKLPLGLRVGNIYQAITVGEQSFINQAFVRHPLGLISGYVKVTARFTIAKQDNPLPDKRIHVEFLERILAIQRVGGIATPALDPFKTVPARGPQGRIPYLDITYLDDDFRIGRGGEGSLFVLSKVREIAP